MNRKAYDFLKAAALIWLPAAGTLIFALGDIWSWPGTEQMTGSIMAMDTFLGIVLGISTRMWNSKERNFDGNLVVDDDDPERDIYRLDITSPPEEWPERNAIRLKVQRASQGKHAL